MPHIPGHVADDIATSILSQQNDLEQAMQENVTASAQSVQPAPTQTLTPDPKWVKGLHSLVINRSKGESPEIISQRLEALGKIINSDDNYRTPAGAMMLAESLQQFKPPTLPFDPNLVPPAPMPIMPPPAIPPAPMPTYDAGITTSPPTIHGEGRNKRVDYQDEYLAGRGDFNANYEAALTLDPADARTFLNTQLDSLMPASQGGSMSQTFIDDYFDYTGIDLKEFADAQKIAEGDWSPVSLEKAVATAETAMADIQATEIQKRDAYFALLEKTPWEEKMKIAEAIGAFDNLTAEEKVIAMSEGTDVNGVITNASGGQWVQGVYVKPKGKKEPFKDWEDRQREAFEAAEAAKEKAESDAKKEGIEKTFDDSLTDIFGEISGSSLEAKIKERMGELGTADLSAYIQQQLGTVTTPDYSDDITQRYGEMGDALDTAASERRRILGESTERGRTEISNIKHNLSEELRRFEAGRVEQQTALEQKVIDRTTEFEQALTERLTDIRTGLGEQVTSEFEEVAALAETLTASQATSSRDAMSRLTAIGDMAAAARMSSPAELSAEALTALNDLEFQVTNQIAQSLADQQAQISMDMSGALLSETMRQGDFDTQQSATLAQAMIGEKLRGTTYEDQVAEMQAQALMADDQYVRNFDDQVSMELAQAQLKNLFGTQDYQRQLDMMNLQRDWQTDDTLQQRGWDVADTLQARNWQTDDLDQQRLWDLEDAIGDQEEPMTVIEGIREQFPKADEGLMITANHIAGLDWDDVWDPVETIYGEGYTNDRRSYKLESMPLDEWKELVAVEMAKGLGPEEAAQVVNKAREIPGSVDDSKEYEDDVRKGYKLYQDYNAGTFNDETAKDSTIELGGSVTRTKDLRTNAQGDFIYDDAYRAEHKDEGLGWIYTVRKIQSPSPGKLELTRIKGKFEAADEFDSAAELQALVDAMMAGYEKQKADELADRPIGFGEFPFGAIDMIDPRIG